MGSPAALPSVLGFGFVFGVWGFHPSLHRWELNLRQVEFLLSAPKLDISFTPDWTPPSFWSESLASAVVRPALLKAEPK